MKPRAPTVKETQEGVEVSIEEFASKNKSQQAFDADIALAGILALLIRVENGGTETYRVQERAVSAYLGTEALPSMTGEAAAAQGANSEYVGKALGWTLAAGPFAIFLWPATIGGSASHTAAVNRRIEQHFESMRFTDSLLKPNQMAAGFFYFKLPSAVTKLENLRVEVTPSQEQTGKQLSFKFTLPTIDLSGAVAAPAANTSSEGRPSPSDHQ
ncbi:MAG TPA: hypothetical protein VMO00_20335 [Methylomirabilota bacterium]|nr:hypothetical protein [Methylomirabilota bacterium]